jgi:phage terminase small subunit
MAIKKVIKRDELNDMQKIFCLEYVKTENSKESAIKAGYAVNSADVQGSRMLSLEKIQLEINRLQDEKMSGANLDAQFVISNLMAIANNIHESTGNRIKALELLGKHLSIFTDKQVIEQNVNVMDYTKLSEADLERELRKLEAIDMEVNYLNEPESE